MQRCSGFWGFGQGVHTTWTPPHTVHGRLATSPSDSNDDRRLELYDELRRDVAEVHAAISLAREGRDTDTFMLRELVARLAVNARAHGVGAERVLIALTRAMTDGAGEHLSVWWRRVIRGRLVRWLLEAYYGRRPDAS